LDQFLKKHRHIINRITHHSRKKKGEGGGGGGGGGRRRRRGGGGKYREVIRLIRDGAFDDTRRRGVGGESIG